MQPARLSALSIETYAPRLTIDEIRRLRATQDTWLRIANDESVRASARENAQAQADRIEREIREARS